MESFYGGRQGASFIIKKKFEYLNLKDPAYLADHGFIEYKGIQDDGNHYFVRGKDGSSVSSDSKFDKVMELCLADESYKDVWYNEYCIIDTINKNNPNNGRIFRRRFPDQVTDGLPYEEIGTIVGPSSGAPMLKPQSGLLDFETIRSQFPEGHWDGLGLSEDKDGKTTLKIYDPSFSDGDLSTWPSSVTLKENSIKMEEGLVKGASNFESKYDSNVGAIVHKPGTIVDEIKYNWFNVRKNTENDEGVVESWCYIGFEIPATVFSVSAKYKTPGTRPMAYEVERNDNPEDSIGHPFWYDWRFEIPGGLRGVSVEKIFINDTDVKDNNNNNLYEVSAYVFDDLWYNTATDTYAFIEDATPKIYKDRSWFCEARILNPSATTDSPELLKQIDESDTVTFFLGEITEIDNVTLDTETGHLEFIYHNQKTDSYDLRYPIDVRMEEETGHVEVDYSLLEEDGVTHTKEEWDFRYPIDINIEPLSGEFTTTYSLIDRKENGEPVLDENGQYIHKTETEYLRYPIDIQMIEETGEVVTTYSCAKGKDMPAKTIHNFRYPIDVNMDTETGHVEVEYSLLDENNNHVKEEWDFRYPINMEMDTPNGVITTTYSLLDENDKHETTKWELDYPKSVNFIEKTESSGLKYYDKVQIDYSRTGIKETPLGYTYKVEVDDNNDQGYIKFINTQGESYSQKHDFSYPTNISINAETGEVLTTYFGAVDKTSYVSFIEDVKISPAHELLIAYTGDVDNVNFTGYESVEDKENGKTYINYGQTIGKLGVVSGPMPESGSDKINIDAIVTWYNNTYKLGVINNEVSGALHVVTTEPVDGTEPISYFVMWDPDAGKWYNVSEIAGSPVGVPAQIGSDSDSWTYQDSLLLADGHVRFVTEQVVALSEEELKKENPVYWK